MKRPLAPTPEHDLDKIAAPTGRLPGRKPTPADRDELLRIWDALSGEGKKLVLFAAVATAKEEGVPEGDGPMVSRGRPLA